MDLSAYLDAAKAARGIPSDNQLASALGLTRGAVSAMRCGRALPGDEIMLHVAELAGENTELALLRLNYWRARFGTAKATYKKMIERLAGAGAAALLGFTVIGGPSPSARAFSDYPQSVYYGTGRGRRHRPHGAPALTTSALA
jgi:transcriptional regulator with XRE-family HTH domain